jgi:hypothetical protein
VRGPWRLWLLDVLLAGLVAAVIVVGVAER